MNTDKNNEKASATAEGAQVQTKTVRRDWLLKRVKQGKIEARCVFEIEHDGTGAYDRFGGQWLEARIRYPRFEDYINSVGNTMSRCADSDFVEGKSNFNESDFRTKSGGAYLSGVDPEGRKLYSLHIHSNSCYTLREKANQ
jgi:hypothetical protein